MEDVDGAEVEAKPSLTTSTTAGDVQSLARLDDCEKRISAAVRDTALAIREIHEGKLYREAGYETFEDYVEQRWGMARATGNRYVAVAKAIEEAIRVGLVSQPEDIPAHMTQRALLKLGSAIKEHEDQVARWRKDGFALTTDRIEAYPNARALLDEPTKAAEANTPYKPPPGPLGPRAIKSRIEAIREALDRGTLENSGHFPEGVDLRELAEEAQDVAERLTLVLEAALDRIEDQASSAPASVPEL
jgi:hypothetical protein